MITIDYTAVVQIIAFLVFWFFADKIIFRPLLRLTEEREQRTEGVKAATASLVEEAERLRQEYESGLAQARAQGDALKEGILADARRARDAALANARAEAARIVQNARDEIQSELKNSHEFAIREAEGIARQMTEKILGRRIA
jgi:F-type H+-transporting ATPase subunit b